MTDQQQAVAAEPRLFVGQCGDATADQLAALFGPFAARGLRALHLLRKGCAMVLYERWAEAEAAQEAHNGRTRLNGGRPLVVTFANPKRIRQGESPEAAIAPRKLFVGQVPKDVTEGDLRPLFEPFGEIVCINVLRTQRGQGPSAGCAFVEYRKWAQAERAMETHNGVTKLAGSEMPLVVKFADAKRAEMSGGSSSSGFAHSSGTSGSPGPVRGGAWDYDVPGSYGAPMPHVYGGPVPMHSACFPYGGYDMGGGYPIPMPYPPAGRYSPVSPYSPAPLMSGNYRSRGSKAPRALSSSDGHQSSASATANSTAAGSSRPHNSHTKPVATPAAAVPAANAAIGGDLGPVVEKGLGSSLGSLASNQLLALNAAVASASQPPITSLPQIQTLPSVAAAVPVVGDVSVPLPSLVASSGGLNGLAAADTSASSVVAAATQLGPDSVPGTAVGADAVAAQNMSTIATSMAALALDPASLTGTAAGLQAVGLSTTQVPAGTNSLADTSVQLAALNAEATHALEAALAGRASNLSADAAAGLLAAQQVLQQAEQQAVASGSGGGGGSGLSQLSALEGPSTATAATGNAVVAAANAAAANALSSATGTALVDSLGVSTGLASGYLAPLPALGDSPTTLAAASELLPTGVRLPGTVPVNSSDAAAVAKPRWAGGVPEGQSSGLDHASQHFKLFVGQVPMEATEQDLWALFGPIGDILELYVLRNNQTGRSRGCAFVTYASRMLAQQAITQLNGRQVGRGAQRQLVVKFADRVPM